MGFDALTAVGGLYVVASGPVHGAVEKTEQRPRRWRRAQRRLGAVSRRAGRWSSTVPRRPPDGSPWSSTCTRVAGHLWLLREYRAGQRFHLESIGCEIAVDELYLKVFDLPA